jgi:hypothetical protein
MFRNYFCLAFVDIEEYENTISNLKKCIGEENTFSFHVQKSSINISKDKINHKIFIFMFIFTIFDTFNTFLSFHIKFLE